MATLACGAEAVWTALDDEKILQAVETFTNATEAYDALKDTAHGTVVIRSSWSALSTLRPQIRQAAYRRLMDTTLTPAGYTDALSGLRKLDGLSSLVPLKVFFESRTAWVARLVQEATAAGSGTADGEDSRPLALTRLGETLEELVSALKKSYIHAAAIFLPHGSSKTAAVSGNTAVVVATSCDMWLQVYLRS